jgi:cytochrome c biogenesis protein CcmG, thiol:disulfide interchange protein DsbE
MSLRSNPLGTPLAPFLIAGLWCTMLPLALRAQQIPVIEFVRDPDPAPAIKAKDLVTGKDFSLDAYKGKVVLLNFWATWCGPCRAEIPGLIELQTRYGDRMQIVGMLVDVDDENDVRAVIKDQGINYPNAVVSLETRIAYGGITALPTVFIVNTQGKVVQKHVGLYNPALYETEVRALLDMPVDTKVETFEDTGEIFLKHADRATMLPGVNTSSLTLEQRMVAMRKLNQESCDCGCKMTLAQCRIYDPACHISKDRAATIVKEAANVKEKSPENVTPAAPAEPASPGPAGVAPSAPAPSKADAPKPGAHR